MSRPTMNDSLQQQECLMTPSPQAGPPGCLFHRTAPQRYVLPLLGALVCLLLAMGTSQAYWVDLAPGSPHPSLALCPEHTGGDRDFAGNGPYVYVSVWLYMPSDGTSLWVNISALWRETKSDWSTASLYRSFLLYSPPPGERIRYTLNAMDSGVVYTDTDWALDYFSPTDSLVELFRIRGDTWGKDIGGCTLDEHSSLAVELERIWLWVE